MPERVPAQLKAVVGEPPHLLEPPLLVLASEFGRVAKKIVPCRTTVEHAECCAIAPSRVSLCEIQPDAQTARRIDFKLPVPLEVAELLGRCIIEDEDHGR